MEVDQDWAEQSVDRLPMLKASISSGTILCVEQCNVSILGFVQSKIEFGSRRSKVQV